ncbi:MAG: DUF1080 domain-containing protein, partial [Verrucomicrobiae bacterium]|nr:DUF1080 domain-containing protein [Verrucomicrobiae bacterium]
KTAATSLPALAQEGPVDRRVAAIRSCAQLGDPTSIPLLFELAKDRETAVSSAALAALTGVPVAEADTALLALLLELTDNRRIAVIDAISQRRVLAAVPSLLKCAADPDAGVANAAFQALGELAEARAIPSIIDALNQTKALSAGENALTAICARQTDRSQCAKLLAEGFTKTSGEAKLAVLRVLGTVGGETALDAVRAATREPDKEVKETALRVLCDWPTPEALPDLAELTKTTPDQKFRILALRAQLRLIPAQTSSDESKIAQLKEIIPMLERPEEKRLALAALVNIPTAEALALVVPHFDSEGVKEEAADAAVSIAEKIVKNNPAKVAEVINLVRTNNKKLLERTRALRETAVATLQQQGFVPIFNGKDMQGWDGKPGWWQVEDSALTSESTPDKPCPKANYLIWRGGRPSNFELLIDFKLSSEGNSGIQIRSEERPDWDTFGYQADMTGNGDLIGYIYHHSRGLVAGRGEKVTFGPDGSRSVDRFANPDELLKRFRPGEWNTYRIVCNGTDISVYLNGTLMCHVTDRSPQAPAQGIIALQMHPGPPMKVQFKNILLRELR